ncbi:MAG: SH3 domain-containing protein [Anaerolineae bacterium]|nr:SH3 domain-containing protein [Anaerolineae bacterium]
MRLLSRVLLLCLIIAALTIPLAVFPITPVAAQGCGTAPAPRLTVGQSARVTISNGVGNNLRSTPNAGATVLGVLPDGEVFSVIGGPQCVENYWWWQVRRSDGQTGWTAEGDASGYWIEPWPIVGASLTPGTRPNLPTLKIAFTSGYEGYLVPHTIAADGTALEPRGDIPALDGEVVWTQDGTGLAFSDGDDIWMLGLFDAANITNSPGLVNSQPAISADGMSVAYVVHNATETEIYVNSLLYGTVTNVSNSPANDIAPTWSPTGQLVFTSDREGSRDLFIVNADGSGLARVTSTPGHTDAPVWSPDGTQIAYTFTGGDGVAMLSVVRPGAVPVVLSPSHATQDIAWSPDSTRVAYIAETPANSGRYEVFSVRTNGTDNVQYTTNGALKMGVTWSPGGEWIVFADNSSSNFDLYAIRPNGIGLVRLTDNPGMDVNPVFQPLTTPNLPDEGASAIPGGAPATAPGAEDLLLIYDATIPVFTMQNTSGQSLNLEPLTFVGNGVVAPATIWRDYTFSPLDDFKHIGCLMLWPFGLPEQPSPPECGDARQGWLENELYIFWTGGTFDVLYNNVAVATCQTAAGRCTVDLP